MKKLKANQRHGCYYCKQQGVKTPAVYRGDGITGASYTACEQHKPDLDKYERKQYERDQHLTEADYQTWYR